jgi:hypothetical protein
MSDTISVKRITIGSVKYLIDDDDTLYDPKTQEEIGKYDRDNDEITYYIYEEEPNFVVKIPYPSNIRFNEKEQAYYDKNKKMIDKDVKEQIDLDRPSKSGEVIIYNNKTREDVVFKRKNQIYWDTGKSEDRPYTYNEGVVIQTIKKIKEKYANETDENKKATLKRTLVGLMPKIQQAKEVDKAEAVSIPKEMEGMEAEERETKRYLREKAWAEEGEKKRLRQIEANKRQEVLEKQRAKEMAETEMMEQADKPALKQQSRDAVSKQYSSIVDKLPMLEKYKNEYWIRSAYSPLTDITESLVATLKNGVLIGDIELIKQLIKLVKMLPKKNGDPITNDVSDFIEKKIVELNPEIQKLEPITKALLYGKNSLFKGEDINKSLKTPLWNSISSVSNYAFKFKQATEDIIRWEKEKKPKKKKEGKGIDNPELYEKAKEIVYSQYPKHSAYRSGQLVKKYKEMGGTYSGEKPKGGLTSWFKEDWKSIGGDYPTYRPTIRVNKDTPLTASEIDPKQAKKQIALKQEIKGDANLPPFQKESEGISLYTNPKIAKKNAVKYLGKNVVLKPSTKKDKKFMVLNPDTNKYIHFGQLGFEDFTKHQDLKRQKNYLNRTANMKGDWKDDKYSANNLAREILWR